MQVTDAIDPQTLHARRAAGERLVILDVREPWETALCVLPDSLVIPMSQIAARLAELPATLPVVVVCHHGVRSAQVAAWLRSNGFPHTLNLSGGIDAWARAIDPAMRTY
mgnify:CR=1 FL=1